jgi:penicillin amidase
MYGDAKGTWRGGLRGKLYKHQAGVNPNFILTALVVKRILKNFDFSKIRLSKMELCLLNQPEPVDGFSYPGYYLPEDRAKRIHNY